MGEFYQLTFLEFASYPKNLSLEISGSETERTSVEKQPIARHDLAPRETVYPVTDDLGRRLRLSAP
ncbi:hypothetical protein QUA27_24840 [Microcoleus sp. Pol14C6]|uniref:hypothetical protein n=1 Tax=unclassified Microcoleus TaxID=2642155 RepID=UPI002FD09502